MAKSPRGKTFGSGCGKRSAKLAFLQGVVYANAKAYGVYATAERRLVANISEAFEGLFDRNQSDLNPLRIDASVESRDVGCSGIITHTLGLIVDSAVAQCDPRRNCHRTFGFGFKIPRVVNCPHECVHVYYILKG